jgi:hypothetical protein
MKLMPLLILGIAWPSCSGLAQGAFVCVAGFTNTFDTRTRIGSIDGPLAGPGYWGQCLAGVTMDTLEPVGRSNEFFIPGRLFPGVAFVPGSPPETEVYVQFAAWDGRLWGTDFAQVPSEWVGRSDIITVRLWYTNLGPPPPVTIFTAPAIIPVPEPSVLALAVLGGSALLVGFRRCRLPTH